MESSFIPSSSINQNHTKTFTPLSFHPQSLNFSFPVNFTFPLNSSSFNVPLNAFGSLPPFDVLGSAQQDIYNTFVMWRLRNNFQNQLVKIQSPQVIERPNNPRPMIVDKSVTLASTPQITVTKQEPLNNQFLPELCDSNKSIRAHLKDMIYFVLEKIGGVDEMELNTEKLKYRNNKDLLMVFEAFVAKYLSSSKTKEEMARYTFKKALKYMKQKMKKEMKKGNQSGLNSHQKRNFNKFLEEISVKFLEEPDDCSEDSKKGVASSRRGNKNNAISSGIIAEAFSSEDFQQGFQEYLKNLNQTLELDNNKRIDKFLKYVENAMKTNSIKVVNILKDIAKYKRIPWLKVWIENTKKTAYEFTYINQSNYYRQERKLVKKEEAQYSLCFEESFRGHYMYAKIEESSD